MKNSNGFNRRSDGIKNLEENIRKKSLWHPGNFFFLTLTTEAQEIKEKISKWDCIRLKSFYNSQEIVNKIKKQSQKLEKIFASHLLDNKHLKCI